MKKRSKIREKAARIPDTRQVEWEEVIPQYLREVEQLNKEQARSHRFSMLIQQLLGVEPNFIETYSAGIEQSLKVRQKDRILKGEADNLFGNVIIEFEGNIPKKRSEAEEQLHKYVAILWSQETLDARTPYMCIATDGVRFVTYSPTLTNARTKDVASDDVRLKVLEEEDWAKLKPNEVYFWLDRYLLRKEILRPKSETIVDDFGVKSHAFQNTTKTLSELWQEIKTQSAFAVIYNSWEKYLRIVYGSDVAGDELFVRHTYLATLAKLMSWARISESKSLPDDTQIVEVLEGQFFKAQGIENFIEEDFFSWLAREEAVKVGLDVVRRLFSLLQNYNLRELSEDVLKSLYQELVDPETRHDLGEFYTPDWLAHRIVCKLLDENPRGSLLDPACGSGTFLYLSIKEKRERLGNSVATLRHILDSVYGVDIHPLAVIVAKTNYVLALGDLLKKRRRTINIPIYLADSIRLPELEVEPKLWMKLPSYRVELDGREIYLPEMLVENITLYDQAIELTKEFARQNKGKKSIAQEPFLNFLIAQHFPGTENASLIQALFNVAKILKHFIDIDRDTIWAFVLKNIYKPLFLKGKFDFVIGNPPWIAYRYMEPAYQAFVKRQVTMEYRLLTGRGELITHLEVATLFLVRAADLYLKAGGTIAFVLPKSLFSADQHDMLRKRVFKFSEDEEQNLFWREVWDCENVEPLFNVPACVMVADKRETIGRAAGYTLPVSGQILRGKLERKNASFIEAENALTVEDVEFSLHTRGKRTFWSAGKDAGAQAGSFYKTRFAQGATIVPRSFWFVQVKPSPLGFNPDLPPLETADRAIREAKEAYKGVFLKGTVENRFLYATLLSTDLLPFAHLDHRLVALPIEPEQSTEKLDKLPDELVFPTHLKEKIRYEAEEKSLVFNGAMSGNEKKELLGLSEENQYKEAVEKLFQSSQECDRYKLINIGEARERGFLHLARWLEKVETEWAKRRSTKAERMTALGWLDYRRKLTAQNPQTKYRVLYNTSGTFLTAAVVKNEPIEFEINGQEVKAEGFLADYVTYYLESSKRNEAYYLSAILNAPRIDALIKPMQARGLWGPRHICKKVLDIPIPHFDATNSAHRRLAELGKDCSAKVKRWLAGGGAGKIKSIGKLRGTVREMLRVELEEIDALVKEILK